MNSELQEKIQQLEKQLQEKGEREEEREKDHLFHPRRWKICNQKCEITSRTRHLSSCAPSYCHPLVIPLHRHMLLFSRITKPDASWTGYLKQFSSFPCSSPSRSVTCINASGFPITNHANSLQPLKQVTLLPYQRPVTNYTCINRSDSIYRCTDVQH
ncbi:uncharacterized protein LOC128643915 isoform X2 [Bombina bombina]|uniref:uncharacterized protein LOC128643915 isoform X2 n=1 Tax=Bombina bombina TaxID=8345 RepID=UPI00235A8B8B|nr:uncharacterized protein LOC128643915 isoform X2 [Bombina bombina]